MNLLLQMPGTSEFSVLFLGLIILLLPGIFFLLTLQKTLNTVSPENRKMEPSNVWLMLIPLFNIVWQFILVDKISQSIGAECNRLHIPVKESKPTYTIGLAWNICNIASFIPIIGGIAALVTFIMYWVKVNEFKNLMITNKGNAMLEDAERNIFHGDNTQTTPL